MRAFIILIYAAVVLTDFLVLRRLYRRRSAGLPLKIFTVFAALSDALPLLIWCAGVVFEDNTPSVVLFSMWMATLYIISVLPRLTWYILMPLARTRFMRIAACVVALSVAAIPLYGLFAGRRNIVVKEVEISSERIPESFDGFRIALFSDLHIGTMLNPDAETAAAVAAIAEQEADMVLFCGDLISIRHSELDERRMALLSGVSAPYGVWASIGNHDTGIYVKDTISMPKLQNKELLLDKIRSLGWRIVDDTTVFIRRGRDSLSLSGISFSEELFDIRHSAHMDDVDISGVYNGVPEHIFNITLSHLPQLWDNITAAGRSDLTLSGHVHGMQSNVRIAGVDLSPARLFYRRWSGYYEHDGRFLYITDGMGYVGVFMRIGVPPEVTVITLRHAAEHDME